MATVAVNERRSTFWGYVIVALWGTTFIIAQLAFDRDFNLQPAWLLWRSRLCR